jgi:hypothetical protein
LAKGRMKVRVLSIVDDPDDMQTLLNEVLKELADYYIVDIKNLGNDMIAVMYLSEKKSLYTPRSVTPRGAYREDED